MLFPGKKMLGNRGLFNVAEKGLNKNQWLQSEAKQIKTGNGASLKISGLVN